MIEDYIRTHIDPETPLLAEMTRDAHVNLLHPRMLSGHIQGHLLRLLVRLAGARRILEIGTYSGYSALTMAEALPDDGHIDTIEINDEMEDFIRRYVDRSEHGHKVTLHIGDALELIPTLDNAPYDLVFIDGDKRTYCEYYDMVFDRVRPGGLIIADNTLWDGKVAQEAHHTDRQTLGIQRFNDYIATDKRVEKSLLPLRDGLTLLIKKGR